MQRAGIALQLYTVREEAKADFIGTLRRVAEIGYPAVQLAGYGDLSATQLKRVLDDLNLTVAGAHIGLERLEQALDEEIDYNAVLGNQDIICPILPAPRRQAASDYHQAAQALAAIGRRCRERGARFSYHNHAFEFERPAGGDGRFGIEILLDESAGEVVWEPDVYWIAAGSQSPADWLSRYAGRCPLIHLKDMTPGPEPTFAEVGEGVIDFKPIFAATADAEWYVVEQDRCTRPPLESAALSLKHLRAWGW
jgi:sugar phosphate isomerase/epimerase